MTRMITIDRSSGLIVAGSVLVAGLAVGAGAFLGGFTLGERSAPEPVLQTELAEKVYTVEDLGAALDACQIEGATVDGGSVTLLGADFPGTKRQCFIAEMGATELADREYTYVWNSEDTGGEYSWSNVHMVWEQTDKGRDVTITVE